MPTRNESKHLHKPRPDEEAKCCGVVEESLARHAEKREKRREKPQPWIVLKMTILLALGIMGYASYVYIGRLCVPMIKHDTGAIPGGRGTGIAFLVIFCFLLLMMLWTYTLVIVISPGKAKDFADKCAPPPFRNPIPPWWDSQSDLDAGPYVPVPSEQAAQYNVQHQGARDPSYSNGNSTVPSAPSINLSDTQYTQRQEDTNVGVAQTLPPVQAVQASHEAEQSHGEVNGYPSSGNGELPTPNAMPMMYTRKPSTTPVLLPEYRYCHKDRFVKPMRAHHCRACGTCVLKYDHHCPWIGQCVGAHNHKFFFHFLEWACLFCLWTFSTLVANVAKAGINPLDSVDAQQIVIVALSFLFIWFTVALLATHARLIMMNWSTVEQLNTSRMKEREARVLSRLHAWYQFGAKRRTKQEWDEQWGRIGKEGNLYWLGSARKNWEAVMGDKWYQWILPLGRTPGDGLTYPTNPRFDREGRWLPRTEWPPELR